MIEKCRLCSSSTALITLTAGKCRQNRDYMRKLIEITTAIQFNKNDALGCICFVCMAQIYNFYLFRTRSLENEENLRNLTKKYENVSKRNKVIPELCDIHLPKLEDLKTVIVPWIQSKMKLAESIGLENNIETIPQTSSALSSQTTSTVVMVDEQVQVDPVDTWNVSIQTSVITVDQRTQCHLHTATREAAAQTELKLAQKQTQTDCIYPALKTENCTRSEFIEAEEKKVLEELPKLCETEKVSDIKTYAVKKSDILTAVGLKSNDVLNAERVSKIISKTRRRQKRFAKRRNSRNCLPNGKIKLAETKHRTVEKVTPVKVESNVIDHGTCDSVLLVLGKQDDDVVKTEKSNCSPNNNKIEVDVTGNQAVKKAPPVKVDSNVGDHGTSDGVLLEENSARSTLTEPDTATPTKLTRDDDSNTPKTPRTKKPTPLKTHSNASPKKSTPLKTHSNISPRKSPLSSTLGCFKYDSPRSSGLLTIRSKVQYVKICKECDHTMYSKNEMAAHRKTHMRCSLCKKRFSSIVKTKLHLSMECDKKIASLVPVVPLQRIAVPSNYCTDEASAATPCKRRNSGSVTSFEKKIKADASQIDVVDNSTKVID